MSTCDLRATACAICSTLENATELYPATFSLDDLSPAVFSARRLPDRVHYRLVRCNRCGLVRSDPVADLSVVAQLYQQSTFDYGDEVANLAVTYGFYLKRLDHFGAHKGSLLEIGCGNGFFLERARLEGFSEVAGVEPSAAAIAMARDDIRNKIVCSMMGPGLFPDKTFDVICLFQVLDHIFDPGSLLVTCRQILKPGGFLLCLNHNVQAVSARLLKDRSPIVDIEHTYLYSPATMSRLLLKCGFQIKETGKVWNRYSLIYLAHLLPFSSGVKRRLLKTVNSTGIGRWSCWIPLGNLFAVGQRPY
jgi:SAM-dependent methyltransferase